jgi:hypothetical protein
MHTEQPGDARSHHHAVHEGGTRHVLAPPWALPSAAIRPGPPGKWPAAADPWWPGRGAAVVQRASRRELGVRHAGTAGTDTAGVWGIGRCGGGCRGGPGQCEPCCREPFHGQSWGGSGRARCCLRLVAGQQGQGGGQQQGHLRHLLTYLLHLAALDDDGRPSHTPHAHTPATRPHGLLHGYWLLATGMAGMSEH